MAENYDLIFGQSASSQYAWSNSDYQNGWQTVGSTPPTAEQFDALQRRSDTKAKELNDRLTPIETYKTHDYRQPSTAYVVGNIAYHASLPTGYYLECTTGGTTSRGDLTISSPRIGGTVSDGTVKWQIRKGVTLPYELPSYMETLLDDKDAKTARATLGAPSTTGANASGSWNINAATATKLASPRTINLTGKAAGSATFDGSANASINVTSVNADTASKLSTARKINITGNATGSANFDGSGDVSISTTVNESKHAVNADNATHASSADSATNADKVDGIHAASMFYNKGKWNADNWATMGAYQVDNNSPVEGAYEFGQVISSSTDNYRFQLYAAHQNLSVHTGRLHYRTGYNTNKQPWNTILDSENYNFFAPTKTGGGASGTWGINISGNAASATNADKLDGYHASDLLGKIYPVGSIYMSMSATNPATLFGVGTWKRISQGRMLLGADDSTYKAGATGGEATHTLSVNEMPAHSHGISTSGDHSHYFYGSDDNNGPLTEGDGLDTEGNAHRTRNDRFTTSSAGAHTHTISNSGGGAAHNNMSPYLVCYIWQRTA